MHVKNGGFMSGLSQFYYNTRTVQHYNSTAAQCADDDSLHPQAPGFAIHDIPDFLYILYVLHGQAHACAHCSRLSAQVVADCDHWQA
eukprot:167128-Chlamydomonas_euryale.AAC.8